MRFFNWASTTGLIFWLSLGAMLLSPVKAWSGTEHLNILSAKTKPLHRKPSAGQNNALLLPSSGRWVSKTSSSIPASQRKATIPVIARKLKAYHPYTLGHSIRVAGYAKLIARALGLDPKMIILAFKTGFVHDIGKLNISEELLEKPGRLTPAEFDTIKEHPLNGKNYLNKVLRHFPNLPVLLKGSVAHHERWDGNGYPRGLKGTQIPLISRIMSVADAFDAMTSQRAYNVPKNTAAAMAIIKAESGKQFDPQVVKVFVSLVESWGRGGSFLK